MSFSYAADIHVDNLDIKRLSVLTPWKSVAVIVLEWLIIAGLALLHNYYPTVWLYIPVWVIISTRLYALYSLIHEAIHYSISRNKTVNDIMAQVFLGLPLFIDLQKMRAVHFDHHKYLHTESDPESKHLQYKEFQFPLTREGLLIIALKDISGFNFIRYQLFGFAASLRSGAAFKNIMGRKMIFIIFYFVLFAVSFYFGFATKLLLYWVIPFLTIYQLLNRLRLSTEHYNLEKDNIYHTRSLVLPAIRKFFLAPYNLGYHLEHHLYPGVPFYNLPELHRHLEKQHEFSEQAVVQTGYIALLKSIVK